MDRNEEYRRNAEYCQYVADGMRDGAEKSAWLALAESWRTKMRPRVPPRR